MTALVLSMAIFAGVGIFWARRSDGTDAIAYRHHLMHTDRSGCVECKHLGWDG